MVNDIFQAVQMMMSWNTLLVLCIGGFFGTIVGALPGLGTAVAITVCIPFTLHMESTSAIALLLAVYACSIYGGSISAILLNTPGTPQSACTGIEGYGMARRGLAKEALGWATIASLVGGLISCCILIIAATQLAKISVIYAGPLEICALICMGLACITSLSDGNQIKGLLMGVLGLLLATIGADPLSGEERFTFGTTVLASGIDLMPVIVGIFPMAEMFSRVYETRLGLAPEPIDCKSMIFPKFKEWKGRISILIRSALFGVGLGILPGTGATAATFIAYSSAKSFSKNKDNFGKGEPDGLVAAEASNNAVAGGALVPTLALGIPGEPTMALMLATLTLHGITPGVRLMADNPSIVYATYGLLILANLLIIPTGMLVTRGFSWLLRLPTGLLLGSIVISSVLGVYLPSGRISDIWIALIIGIVAFVLRLYRFSLAPLVIGYVLGPQLEYCLGQATIYRGDMPLLSYILTSPLATVLFTIAFILLVSPLLTPLLRKAKERKAM